MSAPLFSLVIPTRERPDTLQVCLNILSKIDYSNIEYVVQDNCSGPETRSVVERFAERDRRFVYHRSDRRLSMRQNFEAGLRHARGDYMGIIGDDDGFFGSSLPAIEKIIKQSQPDIIGWPLAIYYWPTLADKKRGYIYLPSRSCIGNHTFKSGESFVRQMLTGDVKKRNIFRIYHGFVSRKTYDRTIAVHGEIFGYPLPDSYANCVLPFFADTMCCLARPASLPAFSSHSSGTAWSQAKPKSETLSKSKTAWQEEQTKIDSLSPPGWTSDIKSTPYHEYQSLRLILESHPQWKPLLNVDGFLESMFEELRSSPGMLKGYRDALVNGEGDRAVIERVLKNCPHDHQMVDDPVVFRLQSPRKQVYLKAVDNGLEDNVQGALQAIETLIGKDFGGNLKLFVPWRRRQLERRLNELNKKQSPVNAPSSSQNVIVDYFADELGIRSKIIPFNEDERFKAAWAYTTEHNERAWPGGTPDVRWRALTACWAAEQALSTEGDFVECGVYMGLLSLTVCGVVDIDRTGRNFWLFDTFSGIPHRASSDFAAKANEVYKLGLEDARKAFSRFRSARLIAGTLPGTLDALPSEKKIAYLSMDLNDATYEMQVMEKLWPRISPGGVVLIDDYGWTFTREQHAAWNQFAHEKGLPILALPTGQGVIVKPPVA
jgi:O-methyltransferase